jgi:uncharacterized protein (DUF58 family)
VAVALAGAGLLVGSPWLFALGGLVAAVGGVSKVWAAAALRGVVYERRLSASRAFPGDDLDLTVEIFNRKLLPLAWLEADDTVPRHLLVSGPEAPVAPAVVSRRLEHRTALLPYERVTYRYRLNARRGLYALGPVSLRSGDLFGIYDVSEVRELPEHVIVYPELANLAEASPPPGVPLMGRPTPRALVRDPARPVGVRDLRPEDSRRTVHWKATARLGRLMVRLMDPVSQPSLVVLVNAATFERNHIGVDPAVQERVISVAAALAASAATGGFAVGLAANSGSPGRGRRLRVPPRSGRRNLKPLLETLAAVTPFISMPVERLVRTEAAHAPWGASLVLVTALVPDALVRALAAVRRSGRDVIVWRADSDGPRLPRGVREVRFDVSGGERRYDGGT